MHVRQRSGRLDGDVEEALQVVQPPLRDLPGLRIALPMANARLKVATVRPDGGVSAGTLSTTRSPPCSRVAL